MSDQQSNQPVDIQRHVKVYRGIFIGLIALTLVTVGVSQLPMPGSARITIAVLFAITQAFFSVGYLMHLNAERKFIHWVLLLTVVFFGLLVLLPLLTQADSTSTMTHHNGSSAAPAPTHAHVH